MESILGREKREVSRRESSVRFDIVIGNPPYQDPGSKTQTNKLWIKFIEKFYEEASEYLYFITPDPWTHPLSSRSKYKKIFRESRLLLANVGECAKHFPGIGSSFTYFLLSKIDEKGSTALTTKEGTVEIDFPSTPWIPNVLDRESIELLNKTLWSEGDKIEFIGSQLPKKYHSKGQTEEYQYPFCLSTSTTSWREEKCKYHNSPKIMFPYLASHTRPILDLGELGATHGLNVIFDTEEEAKEAYEFYLQEDIQRALQLSKWHHGNANPQVLKALPKLF